MFEVLEEPNMLCTYLYVSHTEGFVLFSALVTRYGYSRTRIPSRYDLRRWIIPYLEAGTAERIILYDHKRTPRSKAADGCDDTPSRFCVLTLQSSC